MRRRTHEHKMPTYAIGVLQNQPQEEENSADSIEDEDRRGSVESAAPYKVHLVRHSQNSIIDQENCIRGYRGR